MDICEKLTCMEKWQLCAHRDIGAMRCGLADEDGMKLLIMKLIYAGTFSDEGYFINGKNRESIEDHNFKQFLENHGTKTYEFSFITLQSVFWVSENWPIISIVYFTGWSVISK